MHVFVVYAHPSDDSFTYRVKNEFIAGLNKAGHTYEISDLYKMDFKTDMTEDEYLREYNYKVDLPISDDVMAEQGKINRSDAIVFLYPVFWTEAPAKLVGWFDRVWTYGFAYGSRTMKKLRKALVLCVANRTSLTNGNRINTLIILIVIACLWLVYSLFFAKRGMLKYEK